MKSAILSFISMFFLPIIVLRGISAPVEDTPKDVNYTTAPDTYVTDPATEASSENENNDNSVKYFSVLDFLTEEQAEVFKQARIIYPMFVGNITSVNILPILLETSTAEETERQIALRFPDGYRHSIYEMRIGRYYYEPCEGDLQTVDAVKEICLSVFTEDYWNTLNRTGSENPTFIQIDETLYYFCAEKGSAFGYDYSDEFELISKTDSEIIFKLIGHYKSSNVDPDYTVETRTYTIKMVLTDSGWRFDKFADPALSDDYDGWSGREIANDDDYAGEGLNIPDFLTGEQAEVFKRAQTIYPMLVGNVSRVNTLPILLEHNTPEETECQIERRFPGGYIRLNSGKKVEKSYYIPCEGDLQTVDSVKEVGLSAFTEDYWNTLNRTDSETPIFTQINDTLYYEYKEEFPIYGYYLPEEFELINKTDSEVTFKFICPYKGVINDDPNFDKPDRIFTVKMVLTDKGWRFAEFADPRFDI